MAHTPLAVANEFIRLAMPCGITVMKVHKLVYIAHGWHLAVWHEPLIEGGVVVQDRGPGILLLENQLPRLNHVLMTMVADASGFTPTVPATSQRSLNTIQSVWNQYGEWTDIDLGNLTTGPESLWRNCWHSFQKGTILPLSDKKIAVHYRALGERRRSA